MIQFGRLVVWGLILVVVVSCAVPPVASPTATLVPTVVPTQTAVPVATATVAVMTPTAEVVTNEGPLQIRLIHDTNNTPQPMVDIITSTAKLAQLDVVVDVRSPDGSYALAALTELQTTPDVWIGSEYDLQQLIRLGVVATDTTALQVAHYSYLDDAMVRNRGYAVHPIGLRNYLVSIGNSQFLDSLPETTADLMSIGASIRGRVRYKMAYSWPEGRWFAMMLDQLGAQTVLTQTNSLLPESMLVTALTSLDELRTLGPRDATTYVEATSDFINWYVPYSIDGDAAIRRYEKYAEDVPLRFAPPPTYSASGQRLMPAVDVVYAIIPKSLLPQRRRDVESLIRGLQTSDAQVTLFTNMRWIPINRGVIESGILAGDPLYVALEPLIPTLTTQAYDEATICRWDAYEQILPLVLLNTIRVPAGATAINTALQACIIEP